MTIVYDSVRLAPPLPRRDCGPVTDYIIQRCYEDEDFANCVALCGVALMVIIAIL